MQRPTESLHKLALSYLDIISAVHAEFDLPVAAYNVSGQYSLATVAVQKGWIDDERVMMEILTPIKRAGWGLCRTVESILD